MAHSFPNQNAPYGLPPIKGAHVHSNNKILSKMSKIREVRASLHEEPLNGTPPLLRVRVVTDLVHTSSKVKLASITQVFVCEEWVDLGEYGVSLAAKNSIYHQYMAIFNRDGSKILVYNKNRSQLLKIAEREISPIGRFVNRHFLRSPYQIVPTSH